MEHASLTNFINNANGADYFMITITDNGIGFDNKYAEEIFRVFKRLHSYHEYQGSGVGLSICKKIIEKHNGFISAESKPGIGSSFFIGLPAKQIEIEQQPLSYSA
jgi:light-regulated signal transduction histidine kinase (bacteriophytochrome)